MKFLPIQTGLSGTCGLQAATNPVVHSHLYEPAVLLQVELAPQASGDRHSSKSKEGKEKRGKVFINRENLFRLSTLSRAK